MYVIYWDELLRNNWTIEVHPMSYYAPIGTFRNECQWIIPGTVDPKED